MTQEKQYDYIIRGGKIIDGTGNPGYQADLAIHQGYISNITDLENAKANLTIDARGKVVCPGFIDPHTHGDLWLLNNPLNEPKLRQGVTTEILGQDGISSFPASKSTQKMVDMIWTGINGKLPDNINLHSIEEYFSILDNKAAVNTVFLIPQLTIRMEIVGLDQRACSYNEIRAMQKIVEEGMANGAIGLSTGLTYWPSMYADWQEISKLCEVCASNGGIYATHLRSYRDNIVSAIEEAATIGDHAGLPVHISHLNHRADVVLPPIETALDNGIQITFDLYPYLAGNTLLSQCLPLWVYGNSFEETIEKLRNQNIRNKLIERLTPDINIWGDCIVSFFNNNSERKRGALTLKALAKQEGKNLVETILDLIIGSRMNASVIIFHTHRTERDIHRLIQNPYQMFCTDSIFIGEHLHPRCYGTFPRILGNVVRQRKVISLEEAVRKMTSLPAERFGIQDRGVLRPGMAADIVIFDPDTVIDTATYEIPHQFPIGISYVWINGTLTLDPDGPTGATPGKTLRPLLDNKIKPSKSQPYEIK